MFCTVCVLEGRERRAPRGEQGECKDRQEEPRSLVGSEMRAKRSLDHRSLEGGRRRRRRRDTGAEEGDREEEGTQSDEGWKTTRADDGASSSFLVVEEARRPSWSRSPVVVLVGGEGEGKIKTEGRPERFFSPEGGVLSRCSSSSSLGRREQEEEEEDSDGSPLVPMSTRSDEGGEEDGADAFGEGDGAAIAVAAEALGEEAVVGGAVVVVVEEGFLLIGGLFLLS
mmetsp:Transcript_19733/g.63458  ORF Transcript_19733/g.63458 Transcript_19733/m.63458 type:complete len:226 (-) Transcript_19733:816-1493(-)